MSSVRCSLVGSEDFANTHANALPGFSQYRAVTHRWPPPWRRDFVNWRNTRHSTIRSTYQILLRGTPNLENKTCRTGDKLRAKVDGVLKWKVCESSKLEQLVLSVDGRKLAGVTPDYYSLTAATDSPNNESTNLDGDKNSTRTYYSSFMPSNTDANRDSWQQIRKQYNPFDKTFVVLEVAGKNPEKTMAVFRSS